MYELKKKYEMCQRAIFQVFVPFLAMAVLSACNSNDLSYGSAQSIIDDTYIPRLSSISILSPVDNFYVGENTDTIVVSGKCSGQYADGNRLEVIIRLSGQILRSLCSEGTFTQQIRTDQLLDGRYEMEAEIIGLVAEDVDKDQVTIIKDSQEPVLAKNGIIFPANKTYTSNQAIDVTLVFAEPVFFTSISRPIMTFTIGSSGVTDTVAADFTALSENRLTFRYIVQEGNLDLDGIGISQLQINGAILSDLAGNEIRNGWGAEDILPSSRVNVRIDTIKPSITSIKPLTTQRATFMSGAEVFLEATFNKPLLIGSGSRNTDPRLILRVGESEGKIANYFSADEDVILFRYTVLEGDNDRDGLDVIRFEPNLTLITDEVGNPVTTNLPDVSGSVPLSNILIDGITPEILDVSVDVFTASEGDDITFFIAYNELVNISGTPVLNFRLSPSNDLRQAQYSGDPVQMVDETTFLYSFVYTLVSGDYANRVITEEVLLEHVGGSSIQDQVNQARLTHTQKFFDVDYDAVAPSLVHIHPPENRYYQEGDAFSFNIEFDENIVADTSADNYYLEVFLDSDNTNPVRAFLDPSSLNTSLLKFTYTVAQKNVDNDGIQLGNIKSTTTSQLTDDSSNEIAYNLDGFRPDLTEVRVDAVVPTVTNLIRPPQEIYSLRENFNQFEMTLVFSEDVAYRENESTSQIRIPLNIGGEIVYAIHTGTANDYRLTHTFWYQIQPGLLDVDGVYIEKLWYSQSNTTDRLVDIAGNEVIASDSNSVAEDPTMDGVFVDSTIPQVTDLVLYNAGQTVSASQGSPVQFELMFDETVDLQPTIRIPFRLGSNAAINQAIAYFQFTDSSGDGRRKVFHYNVQPGDNDPDGLQLGMTNGDVTVEELDGGYIRDVYKNAFSGSLNGAAISTLLDVVIDTDPPEIRGISITSPPGTYSVNESIRFQVRFDEPVRYDNRDNLPEGIRIPINIDGITFYATIDTIDTTNRINAIFDFTVPSGLFADSISILASDLDTNGSTDRFLDDAGNSASLSLDNSIIVVSGIKIDSTPPKISSVTSSAGYYSVDSTIDIYITFNKSVDVSADGSTVAFRIEDYSSTYVRKMNFIEVEGDKRLHYQYVVQNGEDADGIRFGLGSGSRGGIELSTTGSITEQGNNALNANLTFPETITSLNDVVIDTTSPEVQKFEFPVAATFAESSQITIVTTFSEPVIYNTGTTTLDPLIGISFDVSGSKKYALYSSLTDDTETLRFTYIVQSGDTSDALGEFTLSATDFASRPTSDMLVDRAGNAYKGMFSQSPTGVLKIDALGPSVTQVILPANRTYTEGEVLSFRVLFDEFVGIDGEANGVRLPFRLADATGGDSVKYAVYQSIGNERIDFQYTVQSGDQDTDGIELGLSNTSARLQVDNGTRIIDETGLEANYDLSIDTATVAVIIDARAATLLRIDPPDAGNYDQGETIVFHLTFSEAVQYINVPDLGSSLGLTIVLGDTTADLEYFDNAANQDSVLSFRYLIPSGVSADGISLQRLNVAGYRQDRVDDTAGNSTTFAGFSQALGAIDLDGIRIDTRAPSVESVQFLLPSAADNTVRSGDSVLLTVTYDEPITVADTGIPEMTVLIGPNDGEQTTGIMRLTEQTDNTLTFSYAPPEDLRDTDGVRVQRNTSNQVEISLNGSTIKDSFNNDANVVFSPPTAEGVLVDTSVTVIESITVPSAGWYADQLDFTVVFSADVTANPADALLEMMLDISVDTTGRAIQTTKIGDRTFQLTYSIPSGRLEESGIQLLTPLTVTSTTSPTPNLLSAGNVTANLEIVPSSYDMSGVYLGNVTASPSTITSSFNSDTSNKVYTTVGEVITLTISYNVPVTVTGNPRIPFRLGSVLNYFAFSQVENERDIIFSYTIKDGDQSIGRIQLGSTTSGTVIERNESAMTSLNGDPAHTDFSSAPGLISVKDTLPVIDVQSPSISDISADSNFYISGQTIEIRVTYDETVDVTGTPSLVLTIGSDTAKTANYSSGSGSNTLVFHYSVDAVNDLDGIAITGLDLDGGSIVDRYGNNTDNSQINQQLDGVNIDNALFNVISVTATDGWYALGQTIHFIVHLDKVATVTGTPQMNIIVGTTSRIIDYVSGSGSNALTFSYTILANDLDRDGVTVTNVALNGSTIKDVGGKNALLTAAENVSLTDVRVDTIAPQIRDATADSQFYVDGESIDITLTIDESVDVVGVPQLQLIIGTNTSINVAYVSGTGSKELLFRYTVSGTNGDNDTDGIDIKAINLAGSGVADQAGNSISNTNFSKNLTGVLVDSIKPTITGVSAANVEYSISNSPIPIYITYNEKVYVNTSGGTPKLTLLINTHDLDVTPKAVYISGTGTTTLLFEYTVNAGDLDDDGIQADEVLLKGGVITDQAVNAASGVIAPTLRQLDGTIIGVLAITVNDIDGQIIQTDLQNNSSTDGPTLGIRGLLTKGYDFETTDRLIVKMNNIVYVDAELTQADIDLGFIEVNTATLSPKTYRVTAQLLLNMGSTLSAETEAFQVTIYAVPKKNGEAVVDDVDNNDAYSSGDTITITFDEDISVDSLITNAYKLAPSGKTYGTGAAITAISPTNGYASVFVITLGTGADVASGDFFIIDNTRVINTATYQAAAPIRFDLPDITAPEAVGNALPLDKDDTGTYSMNDTLELILNEPIDTSLVSVTSVSVNNGHTLGTGASVSVTDADNDGYGSSVRVTLGSSPTIVIGDIVSVAAAAVRDEAGNQPTSDLSYGVIDEEAVVIENIEIDAGHYTRGDVIDIRVMFTGNVTASLGNSTMTISLNVGGSIVTAEVNTTDSTNDQVVFVYQPSGAIDRDGIEVVGSSINKGGTADIVVHGTATSANLEFPAFQFPQVTVYAPFSVSTASIVWLDATDIDGDGLATDQAEDDLVPTWKDKSGADNHVSILGEANRQPKITSDAIATGGRQAVYFDGLDDRLTKDGSIVPALTNYTYYAVAKDDSTPSFGLVLTTRNGDNGTILYSDSNSNFSAWIRGGTPTVGWNAVNIASRLNPLPSVLGDRALVGIERVTSNDGVETKQTSISNVINGEGLSLGATGGGAQFFLKGYVHEILYYGRSLNQSERYVVNNYLSSKWGSNMAPTVDRFTEDNTANGYGANVTGIIALANSSVAVAKQRGMTLINSLDKGFLKDEGDSIFVGYKGQGTTTADLPTNALSTIRSSRVWYMDINDAGTAGGNINIGIDPAEIGLDVTGDANTYELLWRSGKTGVFSRVAAADRTADGSVFFDDLVVNVSAFDGAVQATSKLLNTGYITLAMIDETAPQIIAAEITDTNEVTLIFSEALDTTTGFSVNGFTEATNTVISIVPVMAQQHTLLVEVDSTAPVDLRYTASSEALSDNLGNRLANFDSVFVGTDGADTLTANVAGSMVIGNQGNDTITAGAGADIFDYNAITDGTDTITNFAANDKIDLSDLINYVDSDDITNYIQVETNGSGIVLRIDAHGKARHSMALQDIGINVTGPAIPATTTLQEIIAADHLVLTR